MKIKRWFFNLLVISSLIGLILPFFVYNPEITKAISNNSQKINNLPPELVFCGVFPIDSRPDVGPDRRDGFHIAVDEINAQTGVERIIPSGVTIKAIVVDDNNTDIGGTNAAQSCITQGAHIVIGSSRSAVSEAMQDYLKTIPVVQISYASSAPSLSKRDLYPYFMRVSSSDQDEALAIIDLVDSFNFTRGAMIHTTDPYGSGLPSMFHDLWPGDITTIQAFTPQSSDISTEIQELKDSVMKDGTQFILLHTIDAVAATVIKEAHQIGLTNNADVLFILTDGAMRSSTFSEDPLVKEGMQNVVGTDFFIIGPQYPSFINTWNTVSSCGNTTAIPINPCGFARSGLSPNDFSLLSYDTVYVAAKGFAKSASLNPSFSALYSETDELLSALYTVTHEGAGKDVVFNSLGETHSNYNLMTLREETFVPFGSWNGNITFNTENTNVNEFLASIHPGTKPTLKGMNNIFDLSNIIIQIITLVSLFGIVSVLSYFLYQRFSKRDTYFSDFIQESPLTFLKSIYHKLIIGIENVKTDLITTPIDFTSLETTDSSSIIDFFPVHFHQDMISGLKGRSVLVLIEIAYQYPSDTNPTNIANALNISPTTLSGELKRLEKLDYIKTHVSRKVLSDSRYKNFVPTEKGIQFLQFLKIGIKIAINRLEDTQI
ncbi:MAG: ABC transporter substrate-binding protein [Candidatus Hodarchaeales archaeon]|jgi:ABC-type branched-subunit amino acid transport system substrate-binding protein/DNA-binding MarR family transcriptional regulator